MYSLSTAQHNYALATLGSSNVFPLGPLFWKPSSREKILCPLKKVSLTTPLSVLFSYGETLLRKSMVLGSTYFVSA